MYKIIGADKDAYITNRWMRNVYKDQANTGQAASLDLFKLYGITLSGSVPNIELSRLLLHFDLAKIQTIIDDNKIDVNNTSFACYLKLFDVYGGQPTPNNFTISIFPLSRSFDEGLGKDVIFYDDYDVCNFRSGSRAQGSWIVSGAKSAGLPGQEVDYINFAVINSVTTSLEKTQLFINGEEDLYVNVTQIVSATLANIIPDCGLRIALTGTLEDNNRSYFVKRFASRHAYNVDKHPQLIIKYDDSIQDDVASLTLDSSGTLFMYNYEQGQLSNIHSGSTEISGLNCLKLKLTTEISGGFYELEFSGSQFMHGIVPITGIYSSSVFISSDNTTIKQKLLQSSSITFTPIWCSLDETLGYFTGSKIDVYPAKRTSRYLGTNNYTVTTTGQKHEYGEDEQTFIRVNIFDKNSPQIKLVKTPQTLPGLVVRNVYYAIRDINTNETKVPFDIELNSTRCSSDIDGMYFLLDTSSLTAGHSYTIDIMLNTNGGNKIYLDTTPHFRIIS